MSSVQQHACPGLWKRRHPCSASLVCHATQQRRRAWCKWRALARRLFRVRSSRQQASHCACKDARPLHIAHQDKSCKRNQAAACPSNVSKRRAHWLAHAERDVHAGQWHERHCQKRHHSWDGAKAWVVVVAHLQCISVWCNQSAMWQTPPKMPQNFGKPEPSHLQTSPISA